jgi:hypothetical protein
VVTSVRARMTGASCSVLRYSSLASDRATSSMVSKRIAAPCVPDEDRRRLGAHEFCTGGQEGAPEKNIAAENFVVPVVEQVGDVEHHGRASSNHVARGRIGEGGCRLMAVFATIRSGWAAAAVRPGERPRLSWRCAVEAGGAGRPRGT